VHTFLSTIMEPNVTFFTPPGPGTEDDVPIPNNDLPSIEDHAGGGGRPHPLASTSTILVPAEPGSERGDPTSNKDTFSAADNTRSGVRLLPCQFHDSGAQRHAPTWTTLSGKPLNAQQCPR